MIDSIKWDLDDANHEMIEESALSCMISQSQHVFLKDLREVMNEISEGFDKIMDDILRDMNELLGGNIHIPIDCLEFTMS